MTRRAFSLLEIILALAILAGAVAVLGQLTSGGLENARLARDSTQAQLYCESKMAEIAAGLADPVPEADAAVEEEGVVVARDWLCRVDVNPAPHSGLLEVRVTVRQDSSVHARPIEYSLVRWMVDPEAASSVAETSSTGGAAP